MFKNALVSVSDKENLEKFIVPLAQSGMRVVSTGGTARFLKDKGVDVVDIKDQTQFPEVMDGRVKTLHPNVHMALLARDSHAEDMNLLKDYGLEPFDLVVGNLYPFENASKDNLSDEDLVEFIDIGGPSFLRAAAKNFFRISVIVDPTDYEWILQNKEITLEQRKHLAAKVFAHTSSYDSMIAQKLGWNLDFKEVGVGGFKVDTLRYGENPSQKASWYRQKGISSGLHTAKVIQGKKLSYNNILDIDAAVMSLREFGSSNCCVSVKHNNPCGVGIGTSISEAVTKSLNADPVSVFGGIVAVNGEVTENEAQELTSLFLECVVAPKFSKEALTIFSKKKNLRILEWADMLSYENCVQFKSVSGGLLFQEISRSPEWSDEWEVVGAQPSEKEKSELVFAMKVASRLKSNAIAITGLGQTLGLGMGQVNRVDAVEQAISRADKFHSDVKERFLASDAFFPFPDSIEKASDAGINWVIQPGGSIKDDEVKKVANDLKINMVLTGQRQFLH